MSFLVSNHKRCEVDSSAEPCLLDPPIGSVGMTEPEAEEKFGKENLKIYKTSFKAMSFAMLEEEHKQPTSYKRRSLSQFGVA